MRKKIFGMPGLLALAVLIVAGLLISQRVIPGKLDAFAACLKNKGATYYGAYWCPNCEKQNRMFGNSKKRLPYVECAIRGVQNQQTKECEDAKIEAYPTWEFEGGERVTGVQELNFLAEKTGCVLPS